MAEKVVGETYRGPAGLLKDSDYLTAETIPTDKDTLVQIQEVQRFKNLKLGGGQRQDVKKSAGALKFAGKDRLLILNSTNIKVLCALFGSDTAKWFSQWIALHVEKVSAFGQTVDAIRIRPTRVKAPTEKTEKADVPPRADVPYDPNS